MEEIKTNHLDELSLEAFKLKLVEFFQRHDPNGLRKVEDIAEKFRDQKSVVFEKLTEMYAPKGSKNFSSLLGGPPMGANTGSTPIS